MYPVDVHHILNHSSYMHTELPANILSLAPKRDFCFAWVAASSLVVQHITTLWQKEESSHPVDYL